MIHKLNPFFGMFKVKEPITDDFIFRLHYGLNILILIAFGTLLSTIELYGKSVTCIVPINNTVASEDAINCYCKIVYKNNWAVRRHHEPMENGANSFRLKEPYYLSYYQWVWAILFAQAVLSYIPHCLWDYYGARGIGKTIKCLETTLAKPEDTWKASLKQFDIPDYLKYSAHIYVGCTLLNLGFVLMQCLVIDNEFLQRKFWSYGIDLIKFIQRDNIKDANPLFDLFPTNFTCTFRNTHSYLNDEPVTSGIRTMCMLPNNSYNMFFFLFLWFWYIKLLILNCCALLYYSIVFFVKDDLCCGVAALRGCVKGGYIKLSGRDDEERNVNEEHGNNRERGKSEKMGFNKWFIRKIIQDNLDPISFNILEGQDFLGQRQVKFSDNRTKSKAGDKLGTSGGTTPEKCLSSVNAHASAGVGKLRAAGPFRMARRVNDNREKAHIKSGKNSIV